MLLKRYSDGVEILSVDEDRVRRILQEISFRIKTKRPEVNEIILFGSFSKNEFTPYSDIDIAIIVDQTDKKFIERSDDFVDYFSTIPLDVNLVVYTSEEKDRMVKEENSFIREIMKGVRLSA